MIRTLLVIFAVFALVFLAASCQHPFAQGERLYETHCASCHMSDGKGLAALYPPLAGSDYLKKHAKQLPCIIRHGLSDTISVNGTIYEMPMEGIKGLNETEITNICNYIYQAWGNNLGTISLPGTNQALQSCSADNK
jgi:mono/diheme cytochrome c family protein